MIIYVVDNSDSVIMGMFDKKKKAKDLIKLGKKRWNEKWTISSIKLNAVEPWIRAGGDSYRKRIK